MDKLQRSIDEQIRQAIQNGEFDNLPGKGKPLDIRHNPHEDPTWSLAFKMLKSSGHTLPWIEARQAIEAEFDTAQKSLTRTWAWRRAALDQNQSNPTVEEEWQRAVTGFKEKIANLNKRIFAYNLQVPAAPFKRRQINLDREIERITKSSD